MEVLIRPATAADAEALLHIDTVAPNSTARADYIEHWLQQDSVLVAVSSNEVVGYGVVNHAFFHQSQVEMLMVAERHRGKRVGEQLLKALETLCDTPKFFVTTNLTNQPMQRLLLRLGYSSCGYIDELDPGDPELVFFKRMTEV